LETVIPFSHTEQVINDLRKATKDSPDPNGEFLTQWYSYLSRNPGEYALPGIGISVSFRPGIFHFLLVTRRTVVIYISTVGTKAYADAVLAILDPLRVIVKRVFAREDNAQKTVGEMEHVLTTTEDRATGSQPGGTGALVGDDALTFVPLGADSSLDGSLQQAYEEERLHFKGVLRFLGGDSELVKRTAIFDNSSLPWSGSAGIRGFIPSIDYFSPKVVRERPTSWGWLRGALSPLPELLSAGRAWYKENSYKSKDYFMALFSSPGKRASETRHAVTSCLAAEQMESLRRILEEARSKGVADIQEYIGQIKQSLFSGCVFFIPSLSREEITRYEEGDDQQRYIEQVGRRFTPHGSTQGAPGLQGTQELSLVDLRVLTIRQFGGKVVASYGSDVTHVLLGDGDREVYQSFVPECAPESGDGLLCRLCYFLRYGDNEERLARAAAPASQPVEAVSLDALAAPVTRAEVAERAADLKYLPRFLAALEVLEAERGLTPGGGPDSAADAQPACTGPRPDELQRLRLCYEKYPPDNAPGCPIPGKPLLVTQDWLIDSVLMLSLQPRARAEKEALALLSSRLYGPPDN